MKSKDKNSKPTYRQASRAFFATQWEHPTNAGMICGVEAGENGVGIWESDSVGTGGGCGRQYTWDEWFESGCAYLSAPTGTVSKIEAVAKQLGLAVPKAEASRPVFSRAELEIAEASPEEQRRARLDGIFPKGR